MQTPGAKKQGNVATYVVMSMLIAFASSLLNPVLSLFLKTELHLSEIKISAFFLLLPIATILIVQTVAVFSDMGLQRPAIICISGLFGVCTSVFLYMRPGYLALCTIGLVCLGSYPVAFPQIFASAREFASRHVKDSVMFTTFLRALFSLSWVVGPPVAYAIAIGGSFDMLFLVTAVSFLAYVVMSFLFLPDVLEHKAHDSSQNIKWWKSAPVMLTFISFACLFTAFSSYIIVMPLYITQEIQLDKGLPGYIMGLAAFLEIPIMLFAAKLSKKIGMKPLIIAGGLSLIAYLFALPFMETPKGFLTLQLLSATYISFIGAMGMLLFQDMLPQIPGQATSLYLNSSTTGQVAGGALISLATLGSYNYVFIAGGIISVIGTVILIFVRQQVVTTGKCKAQVELERMAAERTEAASQIEGDARIRSDAPKESDARSENEAPRETSADRTNSEDRS